MSGQPSEKPCPFCGGAPRAINLPGLVLWRVECKSCTAGSFYGADERLAWLAWNTRAALSSTEPKP